MAVLWEKCLDLIYHQYSLTISNGTPDHSRRMIQFPGLCLLAAAVADLGELLLPQKADTVAALKQRKSKTD